MVKIKFYVINIVAFGQKAKPTSNQSQREIVNGECIFSLIYVQYILIFFCKFNLNLFHKLLINRGKYPIHRFYLFNKLPILDYWNVLSYTILSLNYFYLITIKGLI